MAIRIQERPELCEIFVNSFQVCLWRLATRKKIIALISKLWEKCTDQDFNPLSTLCWYVDFRNPILVRIYFGSTVELTQSVLKCNAKFKEILIMNLLLNYENCAKIKVLHTLIMELNKRCWWLLLFAYVSCICPKRPGKLKHFNLHLVNCKLKVSNEKTELKKKTFHSTSTRTSLYC